MMHVKLFVAAVYDRRFGRRNLVVGGHRSPLQKTCGFTLIELLVVIGLIVVLVAGFGLSLGDRSGSSLAAAQQALAATCGSARAQAALHQTEARVLIYAERPPAGAVEKYLRLLQVYRAEPAGSDNWIAAGAPVFLPRGVYVVPPDTAGLVKPSVEWPTNPALVSTLAAASDPHAAVGSDFADATQVLFLQFNADGTSPPIQNHAHSRLVLATANVSLDLPQFNNSNAVRGVMVRANGTISFVNEASGF